MVSRIRLPQSWRWPECISTLREQFELPQRFPDPQRKWVFRVDCSIHNALIYVVCVSSLLISEIKRIIKESEIMKYAGSSKRSTVTDAWKGG